jgi:hyperosmotically inducible protein
MRKGGGRQVHEDFVSSVGIFGRESLVTNHFHHQIYKRGVNLMKKKNVFIGCLVLFMLVATFAVCATTHAQESTGKYVDDSVITTKVKALLAEDNFLKSFKISVKTYKGRVQLHGFVNSRDAVDKAGEIAGSVKGVKSVKNNLIVK